MKIRLERTKEIESRALVAISQSPHGMLTLQQLTNALKVHKAYLSGFLDGLVASGKLRLVDISGPVKVYALADKPVENNKREGLQNIS